jgi:hypothetical protein
MELRDFPINDIHSTIPLRKDIFIDETEWWDRLAVTVDMMERLPGVKKWDAPAFGKTVRWIGDGTPPAGATPAGAASPAATVYAFPSLTIVEILRRVTQMPDETPLDMLAVPFAVYCRDMKSVVSVNDPSTPLEAHLKTLEESPA